MPNAPTPREVVLRHYEQAWNARDLASIDETHAPDFIHHDPSNPTPLRGPAGVREQLMRVQEGFPDIRMEVEDTVAEGDRVCVRFTAVGTHRAPFAGVPATGKPVRMSGMILHRVENGRIVEDHAVRDTLGLLIQLGAFRPGA